MSNFTVWVDSQGDINQGLYFIENTKLKNLGCNIKRVYANNTYDFVKNPKKVQEILYLDKPDIIITYKKDDNSIEEPILCIEISEQTPMGQNAYQRFARATASIELGVPFIFLFPERDWVERTDKKNSSWEKSSPFIFYALKKLTDIHNIPAFAVNWEISDKILGIKGYKYYDDQFNNMPDSNRKNIKKLFTFIDLLSDKVKNKGISILGNLKEEISITNDFIEENSSKAYSKGYDYLRNIPSKGSGQFISTNEIKNYINENNIEFNENLPENILNRDESLVFFSKTKSFRADPYTGTILVYDYCFCRFGINKENRHKNLIIHLPEVTFSELREKYVNYYNSKCPLKGCTTGRCSDVQYLTLHLRDGCKFTKQKEFRIFFYFADMIILKDKVLY